MGSLNSSTNMTPQVYAAAKNALVAKYTLQNMDENSKILVDQYIDKKFAKRGVSKKGTIQGKITLKELEYYGAAASSLHDLKIPPMLTGILYRDWWEYCDNPIAALKNAKNEIKMASDEIYKKHGIRINISTKALLGIIDRPENDSASTIDLDNMIRIHSNFLNCFYRSIKANDLKYDNYVLLHYTCVTAAISLLYYSIVKAFNGAHVSDDNIGIFHYNLEDIVTEGISQPFIAEFCNGETLLSSLDRLVTSYIDKYGSKVFAYVTSGNHDIANNLADNIAIDVDPASCNTQLKEITINGIESIIKSHNIMLML